MTMRALSRGEIERYVDHEKPFDCAGSYKFEARGIVLFEKVETDDPSAITGLPLIALVASAVDRSRRAVDGKLASTAVRCRAYG